MALSSSERKRKVNLFAGELFEEKAFIMRGEREKNGTFVGGGEKG